MGCHVNLASAHTRPRSTEIYLAALLSIGKGSVYLILSFLFPALMVLLIGVALVEFLISRWVWSLRIESWGVAVGLSIFHIIYPLALPLTVIAFGIIVTLSLLQILVLLQARLKGYYSFTILAKMDPPDQFQISSIQSRMFNLVTVAQLMKALTMFLGAFVLYTYEVTFETLYWYGIPQLPLVLSFASLDLIAAIGFHLSRDWSFQLVLVMAGLGFAETMLAWSVPIILVSIWIITLLAPCWAKWGFYQGLHTRIHRNTQDAPETASKFNLVESDVRP
ncbi:MAG: hypothetical protein ACXAEF_11175 [Candidatus Thorarchaeota archaeon]|jgi:hypothetical protein